MLTCSRIVLAGACMTLTTIAGCGGGPTSPSNASGGGTTIAGTVTTNVAAAVLPGAGATVLTVTIAGTSLSAVVDESGYFRLERVPSGRIVLQFRDAMHSADAELANVGREALIEIRVQLTGNTASIASEVRTNDSVTLCHRTEAGRYQQITVSTSAESAHRAHGDGKVGEAVPGAPSQVFDSSCRLSGPAVSLETLTNGEDADNPTGPTVPVGAPVTWHYVVNNTGTVNLTGIAVTDSRGVSVTCPGTSLAPDASMTCTASGVAAAGQYSTIGSVSATGSGTTVTASDRSHYYGGPPQTSGDGQVVQLCHRTGAGFYVPLTVSVDAEPAHRAHGDAQPGEAVPGMTGKIFAANCSVQ